MYQGGGAGEKTQWKPQNFLRVGGKTEFLSLKKLEIMHNWYIHISSLISHEAELGVSFFKQKRVAREREKSETKKHHLSRFIS